MINRNVEDMMTAIRYFELEHGEGFTDYFLDNYALGSWAYWLIGTGRYAEWGNHLINTKNQREKEKAQGLRTLAYLDQCEKFEWFDPYSESTEHKCEWSDEIYHKNVRAWAEFIVSADEYYERACEFFAENDIYQKTIEGYEYE